MVINIEDYADEFDDQPMRSKTIKKRESKKDHLVLGRLIFMSPDAAYVSFENQNFTCSIKGTLKKQLKQSKDRLCCGDLVYFDKEKLLIEKVKKRSSVLMRQNPSHKFQQQILATNVDQVLITVSAIQPALNPYLIDLYIVAAMQSSLKPIIVVNKIDLLNDNKELEKLIACLKEQYSNLDIPFLCVSAKTKKGIQELHEAMKNKASVFSGESGVGKSSLINTIEKSSLKVGDVSSKSQKGMHTTTSSKLLPLKFGGWCVDTPGIQSLGFNTLSAIEIRNAFVELKHVGCQFSDCLHQDEKGCHIKEALEKKEVFKLRLESYYRLLKEIQS